MNGICERCETRDAAGILFDCPEEGRDSRVCDECLMILLFAPIKQRLDMIQARVTETIGPDAAREVMDQYWQALTDDPDLLFANGFAVMMVDRPDEN